MQLLSKQKGLKLRAQRGVSFVEFVGCLVALCGGVVLGSIYLGVDVQTLAAGFLEQADIEVPAILSTDSELDDSGSQVETPSGENAMEISAEVVQGSTIDTATDTRANLTSEEAAPTSLEDEAVAGTETASLGLELKELTDTEKLAATQDCWLALKKSIEAEESSRSNWMNDTQSWQLFDYLLHRKKGHQKAVETIEEFDHIGVDSRLKAHVAQVLSWHRAGSELFDRAAQLLTNAPAGKLTGPFAQSWQSAATQHRMEEKLILSKHAAIASYLEHTRKLASQTANK